MGLSLRRPCRCGHAKDAHEHYRRGSDCSGCACEQFHGQLEVTLRLGRPRAFPAVVTPDPELVAVEPQVRRTHSAGVVADPYPFVRPRTSEESPAVNGA